MPALATAQGTSRFRKRAVKAGMATGHYRELAELSVSSIGIGTYLGDADPETDQRYTQAVRRAVELGSNFIDTAINYRFQRSERSVGAALKELEAAGTAARDELVIATKGGFIPFDGRPPANPAAYFNDAFVAPGVARPDELVAGCHCMTPGYLRNQLEASLKNLGLSAVDIYYVHNPETQLSELDPKEFYARLAEAFGELEKCASESLIGMYGTATWNGYRVDEQAPDYLSLERVVEAARAAGGDRHRFGVVQLPFNLSMTEALALRNQKVAAEECSLIEAAHRLKVSVVASGSLVQGRLIGRLPQEMRALFPGCDQDAQRALQFVRSTPGITVGLVGMKALEHVEENLKVARLEPASLFSES